MKLLQIASALVVAALSATSVSASPLDSDVLAYPAGVQRSVEAREVERLVARDNTAPTSTVDQLPAVPVPRTAVAGRLLWPARRRQGGRCAAALDRR